MTQIVDKRLKKMCDECHSHLDKPCAWLSLGNEYCTEIMDIQQELQRKDNIINELKEICNVIIKEHNNGEYNVSTTQLAIQEHKENIQIILDKIKELENGE